MADFKPDQNDYKNLTPFKEWLVNQINTWGITNFPFLENDFDQLTNYGMMMKMMKCLDTIINNENLVEDDMNKLYQAFTELQTYIFNSISEFETNVNNKVQSLEDFMNNYFDNLDVQEEINNKLDEMVEDGTLQEIIYQFLESNVAWCFDTVNDMKNSTNLINGSYARTFGFHSVNDGGASIYKIRTKTNEDTPNEMDLIAIGTDLVAELKNNKSYTTPEQFGAYGDNTHDDANSIQRCIDYNNENNLETQLMKKTYKINSSIFLRDNNTNFNGNMGTIYSEYTGDIISMSSGTLLRNCLIENIMIVGNDSELEDNCGIHIKASHSLFKNITISHVGTGFKIDTDGIDGNTVGNEYENLHIRYCHVFSMYIGGANKLTDGYINNCVFGGGVSNAHLYIASAIGYKISNIHMWGNAQRGFSFSTSGRTFINGIYLEGFIERGIHIQLSRDIEISNVTINVNNSDSCVFYFPQASTTYPKAVTMNNVYINSEDDLSNLTLFDGNNNRYVDVQLSNFIYKGNSSFIYRGATNTRLRIKNNTFKQLATSDIDYTTYPTLLSFLQSNEIPFNSKGSISGYRYEILFSDIPSMSEGRFILNINYGSSLNYIDLELINYSTNVKRVFKGFYDGTSIVWFQLQNVS